MLGSSSSCGQKPRQGTPTQGPRAQSSSSLSRVPPLGISDYSHEALHQHSSIGCRRDHPPIYACTHICAHMWLLPNALSSKVIPRNIRTRKPKCKVTLVCVLNQAVLWQTWVHSHMQIKLRKGGGEKGRVRTRPWQSTDSDPGPSHGQGRNDCVFSEGTCLRHRHTLEPCMVQRVWVPQLCTFHRQR